MAVTTASLKITWEKLPEDYILPDDPLDNMTQPLLAMALTDALSAGGKLTENTVTPTNYGICATIDDKIVVKAPDWAFIPNIQVERSEVERSYTPRLEGDIPTIVMEFLPETEGTEYSIKPTYPPGKWFFYEQVLQVPNYAIFDPENAVLELYRLDDSGRYKIQKSDENGRYWIAEMGLFLGVWEGTKDQRTGHWLRWWDEAGTLLLWASELLEQERQRAHQAELRLQQLMERLKAEGIELEE
ncbi:MAG: Uma2 family endonuclease [Cyanobacteriota bacterium]|nr:Uma2 family endonuclease [Cyanobacteriota bacterium]